MITQGWWRIASWTAIGVMVVGSASPGADDRVADILRESLEQATTLGASTQSDWLLKDIGWELARARQFDAAERAARAIREQGFRNSVVTVIAEERARTGDTDAARKAIAIIPDPSNFDNRATAIDRVALVLAERGDLPAALETARLARRAGSRFWTFRKLLVTLARSKGPAGALAEIDRIDDLRDPAARATVLAGIARVQAQRGDLDGAFRTVGRMAEPRDGSYLVLAKVRDEAGDLPGAEAAARKVMGATPDPVTEAGARAFLVRALLARGELGAAETLTNGVWRAPKPAKYDWAGPSAVAQAKNECRRLLAGERARRGDLNFALHEIERIDAPHRRLLALLRLTDEREKAGDRDMADRIFAAAEAMAEKGEVGFYLKDLGAAEFRRGRTEESRRWFARAMFAKDLGTPLNQRAIVAEQADCGDLEGALASVASISKEQTRDQARAWVAAGFVRRGDAETAVRAARQITDRSIRAATFAQLGKRLNDAGDRARAAELCRLAVAEMDDPPPEAARIIAHAWAALPGKGPEARDWARRRATAEGRARALLGVARGMDGKPISTVLSEPYEFPTPPEFLAQRQQAEDF